MEQTVCRAPRLLLSRPAAFAALVAAALLAAGADAAAQRLYIGVEEGGPRAQRASSSQTFLNHPTRCDTLLYPEGLAPPDDPACDAREANTSLTNSFDIGTGFGYGSTVGLASAPCGPRWTSGCGGTDGTPGPSGWPAATKP